MGSCADAPTPPLHGHSPPEHADRVTDPAPEVIVRRADARVHHKHVRALAVQGAGVVEAVQGERWAAAGGQAGRGAAGSEAASALLGRHGAGLQHWLHCTGCTAAAAPGLPHTPRCHSHSWSTRSRPQLLTAAAAPSEASSMVPMEATRSRSKYSTKSTSSSLMASRSAWCAAGSRQQRHQQRCVPRTARLAAPQAHT